MWWNGQVYQDTKRDNGWNTITDKKKISQLRKHIVNTAQLQKVQQLPDKFQSDKMTRPPGVKQVAVNPTPALKGSVAKPENQEGIVRKIIPRATALEKNRNEKNLQKFVRGTPLIATNKPLLQDKRQQPGVIKNLIREKNTPQNGATEERKQLELVRKRAEEDKRTRAIEEARRNAIAQQQKQQDLLRRRTDEAKKAEEVK